MASGWVLFIVVALALITSILPLVLFRLTSKKLDVIHALVNSSMTAEVESNLGTTKRVLVLLRHVIDLDRAAGREPSVEAMAEVDACQTKISELSATLEDRLRQQVAIDSRQRAVA